MKIRRSKPYKVRILGNHEPHRLPAIWWRDFVSRGLLVAVSKRLAEPRPGVIAWLDPESGELRLLDKAARRGYRIRLNCTTVERHGEIYCELSAAEVEAWTQREYCVRAA